jgi:ferredoxin
MVFKRVLLTTLSGVVSIASTAQNRFPKPDFESGYLYPEQAHFIPNEALWSYIDVAMLVLLMGVVAWAILKKRVRWPVTLVSLISVAYFGFIRHGCVCSVGAVQNVALSLASDSYSVPLVALLLFLLPLLFTLLFGRLFCGGVCPLGALQELVNIKNYKLSKAVTRVLSLFPWFYLAFAILFAATNSRFIICRFDPFVGIFRLGGEWSLILFGAMLLIFSIFTGRPFCRFICPYGAILSLFSRISFWQVKITEKECNNCQLCHNACPVDAISPPYEGKMKERRTQGVNRILRYLVFLPLMAGVGALTLYLWSDRLSTLHKEVKLYDRVVQNERQPQQPLSLELEAFYGLERTVEELALEVATIKQSFRVWSGALGAFLGVVVGLTLIHFSLKRSRKSYGIDHAHCVSCGRCFKYCPQNLNNIEK